MRSSGWAGGFSRPCEYGTTAVTCSFPRSQCMRGPAFNTTPAQHSRTLSQIQMNGRWSHKSMEESTDPAIQVRVHKTARRLGPKGGLQEKTLTALLPPFYFRGCGLPYLPFHATYSC